MSTTSAPTAGARALRRLRTAEQDGTLADLADAHDLALVVLFGSAADPSVTDPGDLDLAVAWAHDTDRDLVGLTSDLVALLGDAVDVLDLDRGGPVVRERALTRGEKLLEREPGAFATRQMRAIRDAMDTARLRHRQLQLMAKAP